MSKNIEEKVAIAQNNKRYAIVPHYPGGLMTSDDLRHLADMADKYNVDVLKATSAQRIAFIGVDEEKIDQAWDDIGRPKGMAIGTCVRSVRLCPGNQYCPYGTQDSIKLGLELDKKFHGRKTPSKFKIGVSGCSRDCAENAVKDIGFMGFSKGWKVTIGGNGGAAPRLAQKLTAGLTNEEAVEMAGKVLDLFDKEQPKMRIGKWILKIGLDEFKSKLGIE